MVLRFFFFFFSVFFFSQKIKIEGFVLGDNKSPIFGANIYLLSNEEKIYNSDTRGYFKILNVLENDTLVIHALNYDVKKISIKNVGRNRVNEIILSSKFVEIEEVRVSIKDPISEKFAVAKLKPMDIYLNPTAFADPLKAVCSLPSSTNTGETANPELRGSSEDRSVVILNKVPIYKPVRNSQLNGIGNFSIFKTELIDKQYVYANNPPLTYGNTSAGLVEIETIKELDKNAHQISLNLIGASMFSSYKLKEKSFLQLFSNYQFSDILKKMNPESMKLVNRFNSIDVGLNYHHQFSKNLYFNSISYYLNEGYNSIDKLFNYEGDTNAESDRFYIINNIEYKINKSVLNLNVAINKMNTNYYFGNIASENNILQIFSSINFKQKISDFNFQTGISLDDTKSKFNNSMPEHFYAIDNIDPYLSEKYTVNNSNLEFYLYGSYAFKKNIIVSSGLRKNINFKYQPSYLSSQVSVRYKISGKNSILLSLGNYNNYSFPTFYNNNFTVLKSKQIALDYNYNSKFIDFSFATYYKNERFKRNDVFEISNYDQNRIAGLEFWLKKSIGRKVEVNVSNIFLNQKIMRDGFSYKGKNDLNYFIKLTLLYNNPKLFNMSISYITRPGIHQTPTVGSFSENNYMIPIFSENINSYQLKNYNNVSITINKYVKTGKNYLISYFVLNNILNSRNQNSIIYYSDYTKMNFSYFQKRTFFCGVVFNL